MSQVFGDVSPFLVMVVVTLLTQYVKNKLNLDGLKVQASALGFSILLIGGYQIVYNWPDAISAQAFLQLAFGALIYSILGWMTAIGMYEVASKGIAAVRQ